MHITATEVRNSFIDFFANKCGHTVVPSGSVIPHNDPTLLFTNAGMNQFKDVFLGRGTRDYKRAVNTQKCIRAGGKHNDLDDVGTDTYHHTFFEMLGNWSFGDYFKAEAIKWAWELFTEVWGLDKSRIYVTVFSGDEQDGLEADVEAENMWKELTDIDHSHISRWDRKDNFWEMGETGPCGPCSEIHYDCTPEKNGGHLVNKDNPNVIELWNLVFIQFNRGDDGSLAPLPNKHVDTGLGLERIVRVLQGKTSNYDTDLWTPIFDAIQEHTGVKKYSESLEDHTDIAYRVLADHTRCLSVAIADGGRPGAAGREYVLRRILRRGVRHAHQTLGVDGPLLYKLVPSVVETLSDVFPELKEQQDNIAHIIKDEEESFLTTLDRGIDLFEKSIQEGDGKIIDAKSAFELHDTFGFPIDLTEVMAEERGISVDMDGYGKLMEKARVRSRATTETEQKMHLPPEAMGKLKELGVLPTDDSKKYGTGISMAHVRGIWNGKELVGKVDDSMVFGIILDKTPFYSEAGGQVGDVGHIVIERSTSQNRGQFNVEDTHKYGDYVVHIGHITEGVISSGDEVTVSVNEKKREKIIVNHTCTHLLNLALRNVCKDEVHQRGSLVDWDKLRFDYSQSHPLTDEQLLQIESFVNAFIKQNTIVDFDDVPLKLAQSINGVRAVFEEQYPDPVRVVSIGATVKELLSNPTNEKWSDCSIEFCGGTHLKICGDAKHFVIINEQALASGTRRIFALTGVSAIASHDAGVSFLNQIDDLNQLNGDSFIRSFNDIVKMVDELTLSQAVRHLAKSKLKALHGKVKEIQKQTASSRKDHVLDQARLIADLDENIIVATINGADKDSMMTALDAVRSKRPEGAALLFTANNHDKKVIIVAGVSKTMIDKGLKAGDWVKVAATTCGGGGGGRPDTAQAGGKEPNKIPEAMDKAKEFANKVIS
ncbi:MAG: alanine--tRNA ligase [Phycisphaerales bacterium]|jgi:alanyl-tRNA synthetase|nr:alanine--tRNA ligase [Phycisphaerales bacterium]